MYWVYNLPNWLFELLTVVLFVAFGLAGLFASRRMVRRVHLQHSYNDIVGFYLAGITVLYGVTLGLLAIGAWTTYTDTEAKVAREGAAVASLYRTVGTLEEPLRSTLQQDIRDYTKSVIQIGWPEQQKGIVPIENRVSLDKFRKDFRQWQPATEADKILEEDISRQFDVLETARSIRLDSVTDELPSPLWALIAVGAVICIMSTWFFHMQSLKMHIWMTVFFSALIALMVFMVAALDNPYRGTISVRPEPLERVYRQMVNPRHYPGPTP
ncbi:MAG TPA: hypothetical protein VE195_00500 [Acidobacteriaceae bacterium]|nr:hypothetical protein [Acidobacteriaceae bacterium]